MVKFMADVTKESWVEVLGEVKVPKDAAGNRAPITGTSQQVLRQSAWQYSSFYHQRSYKFLFRACV